MSGDRAPHVWDRDRGREGFRNISEKLAERFSGSCRFLEFSKRTRLSEEKRERVRKSCRSCRPGLPRLREHYISTSRRTIRIVRLTWSCASANSANSLRSPRHRGLDFHWETTRRVSECVPHSAGDRSAVLGAVRTKKSSENTREKGNGAVAHSATAAARLGSAARPG